MSAHTKIRLAAAAAVLGVLGPIAIAAGAPAAINQTVALPAQLTITASATDSCSNTGPTIDIGGTLTVADLGATVKLKNNLNGSKVLTTQGLFAMQIGANGLGATFQKQPSIGGVGGNPYLSFGVDGNGNGKLGDKGDSGPSLLGRCVQGFAATQTHAFGDATDVSALVQAVECSTKATQLNHGSSKKGSHAQGILLADNNVNKAVHQGQAAAELKLTLGNFTATNSAGHGGVGGNPLVTFKWQKVDGTTFSDLIDPATGAAYPEMSLGRCKQLF